MATMKFQEIRNMLGSMGVPQPMVQALATKLCLSQQELPDDAPVGVDEAELYDTRVAQAKRGQLEEALIPFALVEREKGAYRKVLESLKQYQQLQSQISDLHGFSVIDHRRYAKFFSSSQHLDGDAEAQAAHRREVRERLADFNIGIRREEATERGEQVVHGLAIGGALVISVLSVLGAGHVLGDIEKVHEGLEGSHGLAESLSISILGITALFNARSEAERKEAYAGLREGALGITQTTLGVGMAITASIDLANDFGHSMMDASAFGGVLGLITASCCVMMALLDQSRINACDERIAALEGKIGQLIVQRDGLEQNLVQAKLAQAQLDHELVGADTAFQEATKHVEDVAQKVVKRNQMQDSIAQILPQIKELTQQRDELIQERSSIHSAEPTEDEATNLQRKQRLLELEEQIKRIAANILKKKEEVKALEESIPAYSTDEDLHAAQLAKDQRKQALDLKTGEVAQKADEITVLEQESLPQVKEQIKALREAVLIERATRKDLEMSRNTWLGYGAMAAIGAGLVLGGLATGGIGLAVMAVVHLAALAIMSYRTYKKHNSSIKQLQHLKQENVLIHKFHDILGKLDKLNDVIKGAKDLKEPIEIKSKVYGTEKITLEQYISKLIVKNPDKAENVINALKKISEIDAPEKDAQTRQTRLSDALDRLEDAMGERSGLHTKPTGLKILESLKLTREDRREQDGDQLQGGYAELR